MIASTSAPSAYSDLDDFVQYARAQYAELSPVLKKALTYLLDHGDEVAVSSMRSVAAAAEVTPITMIRLANSLGFPGWQEMRQIFISHVRTTPQPYSPSASALSRMNKNGLLAHEVVTAQSTNVLALPTDNLSRFEQAAKILHKARHVHIAGFRGTFSVASSMEYVYRLFRPSVSLIRAEAGKLEMELRTLSKGDAVVVISSYPYSNDAVKVAQIAAEAGCAVIAITDSSTSPIALLATHYLLFGHTGPSFFPSNAASLAAIEVLVTITFALTGEVGVAALKDTEEQLYRAGAYFTMP